MNHEPSRHLPRGGILLAALLLATTAPGAAATPDWVNSLRGIPLTEFPADTDAVVLLDEGRTVVRDDGEIRSYFRMAYKILTRDATHLAWLRLSFTPDTRIPDLKGWNLKDGGVVHEVSQKDAVVTQLDSSGGILYEDTRSLVLLIPQVEAGSIIAFEYERRHRPYILQDFWWFQGSYPVVRSQFELELPENWTHTYQIQNHPDVVPTRADRNRWIWKLENLPAIKREERMPPLTNLAPRLSVAYFSDTPGVRDRGQAFETWDDVARWYAALVEPRAAVSDATRPYSERLETREKVAEFVQKEIRYVAIEIGIGGYQPHFAAEILENRFGDCKDKVTLLKTLLQARDEKVHPVLIHTGRRTLDPGFPSPLYFNHLIAAIPLGPEEPASPAVLEHPELGRLLLFDPTDDLTPIGRLPASLQGVQALLVHNNGGTIIETPIGVPVLNRRLRTGRFRVFQDGRAEVKVIVLYQGVDATRQHTWLKNRSHRQWLQDTERFVSRWLPGAAVKNFGVTQHPDGLTVTETYEVALPYFAQVEEGMLFFRPSALGSEVFEVPARDRTFPFRFPYVHLHGEAYEIELPEEFGVEELPEPVEIEHPFAHYKMRVTLEDGLLKFNQVLQVRRLEVEASQVAELRQFYRSVARHERTVVVARRQPSPTP